MEPIAPIPEKSSFDQTDDDTPILPPFEKKLSAPVITISHLLRKIAKKAPKTFIDKNADQYATSNIPHSFRGGGIVVERRRWF